MKINLLISFCFLLTSYNAYANDDFTKVGEARMEYLFWDVYDATLFTPSGKYKSGENPIKFKLKYLRDFEAKDIVKATKEQWEHLNRPDLSQKYADKLLNIWPNISKGDSLMLETDVNGKSTFYYNGEEVGHIDDAQFAKDFLAIWLDKNTSEPAIRQQLLGN